MNFFCEYIYVIWKGRSETWLGEPHASVRPYLPISYCSPHLPSYSGFIHLSFCRELPTKFLYVQQYLTKVGDEFVKAVTSSWMRYHYVWWKYTDVSGEHLTFPYSGFKVTASGLSEEFVNFLPDNAVSCPGLHVGFLFLCHLLLTYKMLMC
jgi:hypothetical protein